MQNYCLTCQSRATPYVQKQILTAIYILHQRPPALAAKLTACRRRTAISARACSLCLHAAIIAKPLPMGDDIATLARSTLQLLCLGRMLHRRRRIQICTASPAKPHICWVLGIAACTYYNLMMHNVLVSAVIGNTSGYCPCGCKANAYAHAFSYSSSKCHLTSSNLEPV